MASPTPTCILCHKTIESGASYKTVCCGTVMHAACLSMRLKCNITTCPTCQHELWPDHDTSSDYSPSSEESDDHDYKEDANGIDTKAEKI